MRWYWDFPFVIFLCDFDPFNQKLYCYTFKSECKEDKSVELDDGCHTIFLSTKGKNSADVSPEPVRFLRFVTAEGKESEGDSGRQSGGEKRIYFRASGRTGRYSGGIER